MSQTAHSFPSRSGRGIVVIGSANTDMVARAARLPLPGETVLGDGFEMIAGGKGANQAVAASRLGGQVAFVGRVGIDVFGDSAIEGLEREGIDTRLVVHDPNASTGVALIGVSSTTGENSIIVAPGANARLTTADVEAARDVIRNAAVVVCQLEIPLECVLRAFEIAREAGAITILNPAPACPLPSDLLLLTSVLTPNETEAASIAALSGKIYTPVDAAKALHARGVYAVVVTLGAAGALVSAGDPADIAIVPGRSVEAVVDTTAAGDCFTGGLALALAEGRTLREAAAFANAAAALSVTKAGAQPSLPTRNEVDDFASNI